MNSQPGCILSNPKGRLRQVLVCDPNKSPCPLFWKMALPSWVAKVPGKIFPLPKVPEEGYQNDQHNLLIIWLHTFDSKFCSRRGVPKLNMEGWWGGQRFHRFFTHK